jgi:hypothetical protein
MLTVDKTKKIKKSKVGIEALLGSLTNKANTFQRQSYSQYLRTSFRLAFNFSSLYAEKIENPNYLPIKTSKSMLCDNL